MVDCRCLVAMAIIHVICLQLLHTTESVDVQPVQLLPTDLTARWPSAYSRELRNGKYMRFGRSSSLPEGLLDDSDLLSGGMDQEAVESWGRNHPSGSDSAYRYLVERLLRRYLEHRSNDAKVWTASGEGDKEES